MEASKSRAAGASIDTHLNDVIRQARERKGLSQQDVADLIGITRSSVSNLEAGRQRLFASQLLILAGALDISLDELVTTPSVDAGHRVTISVRHHVACSCGTDLGVFDTRPAASQARRGHTRKLAG